MFLNNENIEIHMNDRPTPETDVKACPHIGFYSCATVPADFARHLERERDEAREAAEKAKAFKRVLKEDNAKLRRENDEAREELVTERALADRLANFARNCLETSSSTRLRRLSKAALDAWKEARNGPER